MTDNPYSLDSLRTWAFRERGNENNEKRAVRVLFAEVDRLQEALGGFSDIAKRATMEQCAKAMCCGCNENVERDGAYHAHRYENGSVHRQPCGALPIHNLIASYQRATLNRSAQHSSDARNN